MSAVCFSVEGEWLTEFSRARVLERRFDHAYRTLKEGLDGISSDQVFEILRGDKKLVGVNDVEFVDDDATDHKEALKEMFGGVFQSVSTGRFLQPYAIVQSWGTDDLDAAAKITADSDSVRKRWGNKEECAGCSLYYADDPERDVLKLLKAPNMNVHGMTKDGLHHILFKEVKGYPFQLLPAHQTAQAALDEWLQHHWLAVRGYAELFSADHFKYRMEVSDPGENRPSMPTPTDERDFNTYGALRAKAIDATKAKMSIEEYDKYQDLMAGRNTSFLDQMNAARSFDIAAARVKIREQAQDNWIEINGVQVPRAPFENWCLWRGDGAHLALPWTPVCPSGIKMMGDDPYHTDFIVGAGLSPDVMADHSAPFSKAAYAARAEVQAEKLGFKCAVLCGTGQTKSLKVVHPKPDEECEPDEVAVIPNAGPRYVAAAMTAGAVITELGGAMAHLVTVSREKDLKIVRVEDARKLYPVGMTLVVDCAKGDVHVPFNRIDYKMNLGGQIIDVDSLS
jgi:phosphohistidine swiveling domain-containing protein